MMESEKYVFFRISIKLNTHQDKLFHSNNESASEGIKNHSSPSKFAKVEKILSV